MSILNPLSLVAQLRAGNPRDVAQQIIQTNYKNDPIMQNVLQMGLNNDTKGLEQFARQLLGQQGKDFDTEMANLRQSLK
jgi:hypothetical protein